MNQNLQLSIGLCLASIAIGALAWIVLKKQEAKRRKEGKFKLLFSREQGPGRKYDDKKWISRLSKIIHRFGGRVSKSQCYFKAGIKRETLARLIKSHPDKFKLVRRTINGRSTKYVEFV